MSSEKQGIKCHSDVTVTAHKASAPDAQVGYCPQEREQKNQPLLKNRISKDVIIVAKWLKTSLARTDTHRLGSFQNPPPEIY